MLVSSIVLTLLASAPGAQAAPPVIDPTSTNARSDLRATLLDLLSGYEAAPAASELQLLGAGVDAELMAISADTSVSKARRASATWSLGYFPTDATRLFLAQVVTDASADSQLRRSATWALCNGWGDAALAVLEPALTSSDVQLRNQAVRAVARVGSPASRAVLEGRLAVESSAMVRDAITASLAEAK